MSKIKYDEKGIWIPFSVSKDKPCPICDAINNNAHTVYCPNINYHKLSK